MRELLANALFVLLSDVYLFFLSIEAIKLCIGSDIDCGNGRGLDSIILQMVLNGN